MFLFSKITILYLTSIKSCSPQPFSANNIVSLFWEDKSSQTELSALFTVSMCIFFSLFYKAMKQLVSVKGKSSRWDNEPNSIYFTFTRTSILHISFWLISSGIVFYWDSVLICFINIVFYYLQYLTFTFKIKKSSVR